MSLMSKSKGSAEISPATAALLVAIGGIASIGGALFFQFVIGLRPCPLCLEQRIAYYVAIPVALIVAWLASRGGPRSLVQVGLAIVMLAFVINAGLGVYHSGIEWKWWAGPTDCTGDIADFGSAGSLLKKIQNTSVVRCDEAAWRFLGLSLAGYNALISLALAALAALGLYGSSSVSQYK
jgi:disulfide bond formation protein DsbB